MPGSFEAAHKQLELFVRQFVALNTQNQHGQTKRQILESQRKQILKAGKVNEDEVAQRFRELDPVVLIAGTEYLLQWFFELSTSRSQGMSGYLSLSYAEIKAFSELMDYELMPWEVDAVKVMDRAFMDENRKLEE